MPFDVADDKFSAIKRRGLSFFRGEVRHGALRRFFPFRVSRSAFSGAQQAALLLRRRRHYLLRFSFFAAAGKALQSARVARPPARGAMMPWR